MPYPTTDTSTPSFEMESLIDRRDEFDIMTLILSTLASVEEEGPT